LNQQVANRTFRARSRLQKMQRHKVADFVAEWTELGFAVEGVVPESAWLVSCDRAWGTAEAGAAAILTSPLGIKQIKLRYTAQLQFNGEADKCTNNIAEYEAILLGL
jgi:hypothetical protein